MIKLIKKMERSGKIIAVLPLQSGTGRNGNAWEKQDFVIETQDQYPKKMCYTLFGSEKIQQYGAAIGDDVDVSFDIDAKEWNGKWFNSINAWKVIRRNVKNNNPVQPPFATKETFTNDAKDDLPF